MHIAFDIDGTICDTGADGNWDDPLKIRALCRPIPQAIRRIIELYADGHTISFVTGRSRKLTKGVTNEQLKAWLGPWAVRGTDIEMRDFEPYDLMQCVIFKMDALRYLEPDVYVGDLPMDLTAAVASGVKFMPAEWFHKGIGFDLIVNPDFNPDRLRMKSWVVEDGGEAELLETLDGVKVLLTGGA